MMIAISTTGTLELTAYATLGLAVVTGALAGATFWMVKLTRRSLSQTRQDIEISRREVEEAHRPVVVPLADKTGRMDLGADGAGLEKTPQLRPSGRLFVPLRNIGSGPALNVEAFIGLLDDAGDPTNAFPRQTPGRLAGLGELRSTPVLIELQGWGGSTNSEMPSFSLFLDYDDVAGKSWRTACIYVVPTGRYEGMTIGTIKREKRPLSDLIRPVAAGTP